MIKHLIPVKLSLNENSIDQSLMDGTPEHFCSDIIDNLGLREDLLRTYWIMVQNGIRINNS